MADLTPDLAGKLGVKVVEGVIVAAVQAGSPAEKAGLHENDVIVAMNGRAVSSDFFFLREAIASGVGIGPLPWFLASQDVAAGRITRVLPEYRVVGGTAYLVYPPAKPLAPKLVRFCEHLLEQVPRLTALP